MKARRFFTVAVDLPGRRLLADCEIAPRRSAPHAGADSPRYLDPGSRLYVKVIRYLEDRVDVTDQLLPRTRALIEYAIREATRQGSVPALVVPAISTAAPASFHERDSDDQIPLPLEDGHLKRAMERTS